MGGAATGTVGITNGTAGRGGAESSVGSGKGVGVTGGRMSGEGPEDNRGSAGTVEVCFTTRRTVGGRCTNSTGAGASGGGAGACGGAALRRMTRGGGEGRGRVASGGATPPMREFSIGGRRGVAHGGTEEDGAGACDNRIGGRLTSGVRGVIGACVDGGRGGGCGPCESRMGGGGMFSVLRRGSKNVWADGSGAREGAGRAGAGAGAAGGLACPAAVGNGAGGRCGFPCAEVRHSSKGIQLGHPGDQTRVSAVMVPMRAAVCMCCTDSGPIERPFDW